MRASAVQHIRRRTSSVSGRKREGAGVASTTVSASSLPSVRLMTEPLQRRCTIHVLRPFARTLRPSPRAAQSHSTASRPSAGAKARARHRIFVLFVMFRSLPFVSVATGAAQVPHRWGTPRTRRVTVPSSKIGGIGIAVLKRRAGCKPLCLRDFRRLADAWEDCYCWEQKVREYSVASFTIYKHHPKYFLPNAGLA